MTHHRVKGFTVLELTIVIVILGILAAIAVPAFFKYLRRAKIAEVEEELSRLYRSAIAYYAADHLSSDVREEHLPAQFPAEAGTTPGACVDACYSQPTHHCPGGNGEGWTDPTWQALRFSISEPHYFVYTFATTDVLTGFTARAEANLDGDAICSTYERSAQVVNGVVEGSPNMTSQLATE